MGILARPFLRWARHAAPLLLLAACTDELPTPTATATDGDNGDGRVHFAVLPPASAEVEITSRATVDAQSAEKAIYMLRIMVFDRTGKRIPDALFHYYDNEFPTNGTVLRGDGLEFNYSTGDIINFDPATAVPVDVNKGFTLPILPFDDTDGQTTNTYSYLDVDGEMATIDLDPRECTVWALANIGRWDKSLLGYKNTSSASSTADTPGSILNSIKNRDDLRRLYGERLTDGFATNRQFLPMVGTYHGDSRTTTDGSGNTVEKLPVVDTGALFTTTADGSTVTKTHDDYFSGSSSYAPAGYAYDAPGTINLTEPRQIGSPYTIEMDQIVAKVRFNISGTKQYIYSDGKSDYESQDGSKTLQSQVDWDFYFDDWSVANLPRYTYIIPHQHDIADYLSNQQYLTDANIGENDFNTNRFVPSDDTEATAFSHNGFGDGSVESNGQDWIHAGKTGPPASIDGSLSDYPDWEKEKLYIETDPTTGKNYFHFYTYGNRRGNQQGEANTANLGGASNHYGSDYTPGGATGEALKTLKAPANASFLIIKGIVRKVEKDAYGNELSATSQSVVYKIALGCNRTDDYNVYRNTCYTLHIKVQGFSQSDLSVDGTAQTNDKYNSSVHQIYNLQVSAPYINMMDCHYDKRYVQLTGGEGSGEMTVYNKRDFLKVVGTDSDGNSTTQKLGPDDSVDLIYQPITDNSTAKCDWIRMAKVNNNEGDDGLIHSFTDITDADGKTITLTDFSQTEQNFAICAEEYVNNIVSDTYTIPNRPRYAVLQIKHDYKGRPSDVLNTLAGDQNAGKYIVTDEDGDGGTGTKLDGMTGDGKVEVYKFIEIVQYPPLIVPANSDFGLTHQLLVEQFEEYKMALDPRNSAHTDKISALEWGWKAYNNGSSFYDFDYKTAAPQDNFVYGLANSITSGTTNTSNIVLSSFDTNDNVNKYDRFWRYTYASNNKNADYAARYCYDKGVEGNRGWYLPSLNELNALTVYDLTSLTNADKHITTLPTALTDKQGGYFAGVSQWPLGTSDNIAYWTSSASLLEDSRYAGLEQHADEFFTGTDFLNALYNYYNFFRYKNDFEFDYNNGTYTYSTRDGYTYVGPNNGGHWSPNYPEIMDYSVIDFFIWRLMKRYNTDANSDYYYKRCARASSQGQEWLNGYVLSNNSATSTTRMTEFFPYLRSDALGVRAVRVAPTN